MNRPLTALLLAFGLAACDAPLPNAEGGQEHRLQAAAELRRAGKAEQAVALLRQARAESETPDVLMPLGYALLEAGHPEEAASLFDALITMEPGNAQAHNGKGVSFDKAGNHAAAQEIYQRALELSPDNMTIQNNLAMSLILNRQFDQAIALLEKLHAQTGENKTIRRNLALAYGLKGQRQKALDLNLKDMTPQQARENARFYDAYAREMKKTKPGAKPPAQIGFTDTPAAVKKKPLQPAPTEVKEVKEVKPEPATAAPEPAPEKPETRGTELPTSAPDDNTDPMYRYPR